MSNSTLVSYTKISPNKDRPRSHVIDRITPHCFVGQVSVERIGREFEKASRRASCNYGIGADGQVALIVDEADRSWCSDSPENDHRAVTFECACDSTAPYAMNDAVYASILKLCEDICRRNGKRKLLWLGDKGKALSYEPAADEMVITVHRWFAAKSCPGDWLYARLGDVAEKVTASLSGEEAQIPEADEPKSGDSPEKTVWDFLYARIRNAYGVAGLMGNLYAESGLRPDNLQNSFERSLGMDDATYTAAVDSGIYTNFVRDSAGYGLAQWTFWSRKQALLDFAKSEGKSIGDLSMQLGFLWKELSENYPSVISALKNAVTVEQASTAVLVSYERPADQGIAVQKKRAGYGQTFFDLLALSSPEPAAAEPGDTEKPGFQPYLVHVATPNLNIRSGPGTDYARTGKYTGVGVFTIVEYSDGKGSSHGWGRLKSGLGWIALDYARRLS